MSSPSSMYKLVAREDLTVTHEEASRPCLECGDEEIEIRTDASGTTTSCLTCGRIRRFVPAKNETKGEPLQEHSASSEREEAIVELRRAGVPIPTIVERVGLSRSTIEKLSSRLGVSRRRPGARKYSQEDVLDALRAFREESGHWPTWGEWSQAGHHPSASVAIRIFGSWSGALRAAKGE